MNTLSKFGYPESLIMEYNNWFLLFRPDQVTIGSLILITKNDEHRLSEISKNGFEELRDIVIWMEDILKSTFEYDRINYLMLMMVDPEVHYHIIPRYSKEVIFQGVTFKDKGWPSIPALGDINKIDNKIKEKLVSLFREKFANIR